MAVAADSRGLLVWRALYRSRCALPLFVQRLQLFAVVLVAVKTLLKLSSVAVEHRVGQARLKRLLLLLQQCDL